MADTCIVLSPPGERLDSSNKWPMSLLSRYLADYRHPIPWSDCGTLSRLCITNFNGLGHDCRDCGERCERHMFFSVAVHNEEVEGKIISPLTSPRRYNDMSSILGAHLVNEQLSKFVNATHTPENNMPLEEKDGIFRLHHTLCISRTRFVREKGFVHNVIEQTVFDTSSGGGPDTNSHQTPKYSVRIQEYCHCMSSNKIPFLFDGWRYRLSRLCLTLPDATVDSESFCWDRAAVNRGRLPSFKARFSLHIPLEMKNRHMYEYDDERSFGNPVRNEQQRCIMTQAASLYFQNAISLYTSNLDICYGLQSFSVEGRVSLNRARPQFTLKNTDLTIPLAIREQDKHGGKRAAVLYDFARYLNMGETDTLWVGDVRFKPQVTRLKDLLKWRETPLIKINCRPGVYEIAASRVRPEVVLETQSGEELRDELLPTPMNLCQVCTVLWERVLSLQNARADDDTLHAHLVLLPPKARYDRTVGNSGLDPHQPKADDLYGNTRESECNDKTHFKRYVHTWACHERELEEIAHMHPERETDLIQPFNWWDNVDRDLYFKTRLLWPLPDTFVRHGTSVLDTRIARLSCATKLVIKNPDTFFRKNIVTVDIAYGGRRGAVYSLVDQETWQVCGMLVVDVRGRTTAIHQSGSNSEVIGLHFEAKTSKDYWESVHEFAEHACQPHSEHKEGDLHTRLHATPPPPPLPVGRLPHATKCTVSMFDMCEQSKLPSMKVLVDVVPHDERWYGREDGTPYDLKMKCTYE